MPEPSLPPNLGLMLECMYKSAVCNTSNLKPHFIDKWKSVSQNVINKLLIIEINGYVHAHKQKDITLNI